MIFNSTYFRFNNHISKQNFGTSMGSPLSPIIADLVMRDLEERALETLGFPLLFYIRYVDNIVMTVSSTSLKEVVNTFNSFHPRLQFALETRDEKLNFLDVNIIKNNNFIEFNINKPSFFWKISEFSVSTPSLSKRGTVMRMVVRAFFLSQDFILKI